MVISDGKSQDSARQSPIAHIVVQTTPLASLILLRYKYWRKREASMSSRRGGVFTWESRPYDKRINGFFTGITWKRKGTPDYNAINGPSGDLVIVAIRIPPRSTSLPLSTQWEPEELDELSSRSLPLAFFYSCANSRCCSFRLLRTLRVDERHTSSVQSSLFKTQQPPARDARWQVLKCNEEKKSYRLLEKSKEYFSLHPGIILSRVY